MNLGIADAVDLSWKIAAVLHGWGGQALLDSYEIERRPIHEMVLDESERNFSVLPSQLFREGIEEGSPGGAAIRKEVADLIEKSKRDEFYAIGLVLGFRCCRSPIIASDGTDTTSTIMHDALQGALPGSLAPHECLPAGASLS